MTSSLTGSSENLSRAAQNRFEEESRSKEYTYDARDSDEYGNETTYYRDTPRKILKNGH